MENKEMMNEELDLEKLDLEELEKIAGGMTPDGRLESQAFEVWRDKMIAKYGNGIYDKMNSEETRIYDYLSRKNKWHMMHG